MASNLVPQSDSAPNCIVNSKMMQKLYNEAVAFETKVVRFWHARINQDFRIEEGWLVSPEQFAHEWPDRNSKLRMDMIVELYDETNDVFSAVMFAEAKREGASCHKVEEQALKYAEAMVEGRELQRIHVLTTIGTSFRTWYFANGAKQLTPLFGRAGSHKSEYVIATTLEASNQWRSFVNEVKSGQTSSQAHSQSHVPSSSVQWSSYTQTPGGPSSSASADLQGYGGAPSNTIDDVVWVSPVLTSDGTKTKFTFWNGSQEVAVKTYASKWVEDENLNTRVWYSNDYQIKFAWATS